jgi:hypothetical protein
MTNLLIETATVLLLAATPAIAKLRANPYRYGYSHRVSRAAYGANDLDRGRQLRCRQSL